MHSPRTTHQFVYGPNHCRAQWDAASARSLPHGSWCRRGKCGGRIRWVRGRAETLLRNAIEFQNNRAIASPRAVQGRIPSAGFPSNAANLCPPLDPGFHHKNPSRPRSHSPAVSLSHHVLVHPLACLSRVRPGRIQPGCLHPP